MLAPPVVEGEEDTQLPQNSVPIPNVADEAVFKEWDDRVVMATTTAASLYAEQDSGNILKTQSTAIPNVPLSHEIGTGGSLRCQEAMESIIAQTRSERVPTPFYDSPLLGGNTPESDEERIEQHELTDFVPPTPHDSPLSGGHTPGNLVINKLKKKVKRLEKKQRARTPWKKLFKIGTSRRKSLDKENVSKQGRNLKTRPMFEEGNFDDDFDDIDDMVNEANDAMENAEGDTETQGRNSVGDAVTTAGVSISAAEPRTPPTTTTTVFEDEDLTITQTLVKMRSEKAKEKGVAFRDVEESARPIRIRNLPTIDPKDKGKGIMQEPEKPPKNLIKAQIQRDAEIA
ncbi:hypothetical protein Tco_1380209 [Tanacetum coccineum]